MRNTTRTVVVSWPCYNLDRGIGLDYQGITADIVSNYCTINQSMMGLGLSE